ncbi:MAG: sigma-70 family RNA polymerase sigma factor [Verrucomicrobiota bacterium]
MTEFDPGVMAYCMEPTRESLLERVRTTDKRAWQEFYATYWGPILGYCRKLGLRDADAHDVLQLSMMQLMRALPKFQYDRSRGKFRNFVLTIVHRQCLRMFKVNARRKEISLEAPATEEGQAPIERLPDNETPPPDPDEQAWRESLLIEAMRRLEANPRIQAETLAAFRAYAIEGRPAPEVAEQFGLKENTLYQIRNRIIKKLEEEVALLMQEENPEA